MTDNFEFDEEDESASNNLSVGEQIIYDAETFLFDPLKNIANYNCKSEIFIICGPRKFYNIYTEIKYLSEQHIENTVKSGKDDIINNINKIISDIVSTKKISSKHSFLVDFFIPHTHCNDLYNLIITIKKVPTKIIKKINLNNKEFIAQKYIDDIQRIIRLKGSRGATKSEITRFTQSIDIVTRDNLLRELIISGKVILDCIPTKARPQTYYKWIAND